MDTLSTLYLSLSDLFVLYGFSLTEKPFPQPHTDVCLFVSEVGIRYIDLKHKQLLVITSRVLDFSLSAVW